VHLTAKFHHPTLNRSEVIVLTNRQSDKQTDAAENIISLRYATPVAKDVFTSMTPATYFTHSVVAYSCIFERIPRSLPVNNFNMFRKSSQNLQFASWF